MSASELKLLSAQEVDHVEIDATGAEGTINIILRQRPYLFHGELSLGTSTRQPNITSYDLLRYQDPHWYALISGAAVISRQHSDVTYETTTPLTDAGWVENPLRSGSNSSRISQTDLEARVQWAPNKNWELGVGYTLSGYSGCTTFTPKIASREDAQFGSQTKNSILNGLVKYQASVGTWLLRGRHTRYGSQMEDRSRGPYARVHSLFDEWAYDLAYRLNPWRMGSRITQYWQLAYQGIHRTYELEPQGAQEMTRIYQLGLSDYIHWQGVGSISLYLRTQRACGAYLRQRWVWLPSLSFSSRVKQINWGISYARQVTRPLSEQLNPTAIQSDYNTTFVGNPDLADQYSHTWDLNLSTQLREHYLGLVASYRSIRDGIEQVYVRDLYHQTYQNLGRLDEWGGSAFWQGAFASGKGRISLNATARYGRYSLRDDEVISTMLPQAGWTVDGYAGLTYVISPQWFLSSGLQWWPRTLTPYGYTASGLYSYGGLTYTPSRDHWKIQLSVMGLTRQAMDTYLYTQRRTFHSSHRLHQLAATISIQYSFGKQFEERQTTSFISTSDYNLPKK